MQLWLLTLVVGGLATLLAGFFLLCLFAARYERRYIRRPTPLDDAQGPASQNKTAAKIADAAIPLGFFYFGAFRDEESGILKTRVDLYLTDDGEVMLLIPSMTKTMGLRLYTRMADDTWLITGEAVGETDLSGLHLVKNLPGCSLSQTLCYHRDRIASQPTQLVPFNPEKLVNDLLDHEQLRAQMAVDTGLARWVSKRHDCYTSTWRGAFKIVAVMLLNIPSVIEANRLAEGYKSKPDIPTES